MHRYVVFGKPAPEKGIFHDATYRDGWLQAALQRDVPSVWRTIFDSSPTDSVVPPNQPDEVEGELKRLLPWIERTAVRREPGVAVYSSAHGKELTVDVWDASLATEVETGIAVILKAAAGRVDGVQWETSHRHAPLRVARGHRCGYSLKWLRVSEDRATADAVTAEMGRMVYEGLVSAVLRGERPAETLARIPTFEQSGFYLELPPVRAHGRVAQQSTKPMYRRAEFTMDVAVDGTWRVGGGGLFGYGQVKAES